ncbi:MAG: hypothetical protein WBG37_01395 [Desulfobacterales bacterium]
MMNKTVLIVAAFVLGWSANGLAMDHAKGHSVNDSGSHAAGHSQSGSEDHAMDTSKEHAMGDSHEHEMDHAGGHAHGGNFKHAMMMEGMHSEFEVMSLASMNMSDPEGNTHHIMVKLAQGEKGEAIKGAVGKIKVIAPSGAEQVSPLKDYGGVMAANFTFKEKGKYGVICLVKAGDDQRVFKFWYPHK